MSILPISEMDWKGRIKDKKFDFIDRSGQIVILLEFDLANNFKHSITLDYLDLAYGFSEGVAAIREDDKWMYIDKTGKTIIATNFDELRSFSQGRAAVKKDTKWGYIDKKRTLVIPIEYEYADAFSEGLTAVGKEINMDILIKQES